MSEDRTREIKDPRSFESVYLRGLIPLMSGLIEWKGD